MPLSFSVTCSTAVALSPVSKKVSNYGYGRGRDAVSKKRGKESERGEGGEEMLKEKRHGR